MTFGVLGEHSEAPNYPTLKVGAAEVVLSTTNAKDTAAQQAQLLFSLASPRPTWQLSVPIASKATDPIPPNGGTFTAVLGQWFGQSMIPANYVGLFVGRLELVGQDKIAPVITMAIGSSMSSLIATPVM